VDYLERMDLAYAAADLAICRSGAMTVAEVSAVGLPAIFVPLPHGNGEQRLNALPVVEHGGGEIVEDADLTPERLVELVVPMLTSGERLSAMSAATRRTGHADADETLARMVLAVVEGDAGADEGAGTMGAVVRHEGNER
jgi:UDP-N-acetylglucosamine--N-acetylmuramyl-(pentapeptide) pyrophosphoryl-undecaprenol N-acetylglucosamine transferase